MGGLLITGGAGFIGCNLVRTVLAESAGPVVVLDKLTYAGCPANLAEVRDAASFTLVEGDIADAELVRSILQRHRPRAILNLAAETHVDRSIDAPDVFLHTNVAGTHTLLCEARRYWDGIAADARPAFRFLQVSTDEVYGSLEELDSPFTEASPFAPNSPYAASKAAADHLVRAWHRTYGLPTLTTRCSNNYGPFQFPEKLIPLTVLNAMEGRPLPLYGDGGHVRDWIHVDDHCAALLRVLERGTPGTSYNVGAGCERRNLELVDAVCGALDELLPAERNPALRDRSVARYAELKTHVEDRPGHDRRYAVDSRRARAELGWAPCREFGPGIAATVAWYLEHRDWCAAVQRHARYSRERLGRG